MGTEKNAIALINGINRKKYNLVVAVINIKDNIDCIKLKPSKIHNLNSRRTLLTFFKCYNVLKKEKPDIVFSYMHHINLMIGAIRMFNLPISKFIARESNIPSIDNMKLRFGTFYRLLYRIFYKNYHIASYLFQ